MRAPFVARVAQPRSPRDAVHLAKDLLDTTRHRSATVATVNQGSRAVAARLATMYPKRA